MLSVPISSPLPLNNKNILLGLANNEVLVFGHTHRSFKSDDVINTGSWVVDPRKKAHSYVEIDNGNFELKEFKQTKQRLQQVILEAKSASDALCPSCGEAIEQEVKFCCYCGFRLKYGRT